MDLLISIWGSKEQKKKVSVNIDQIPADIISPHLLALPGSVLNGDLNISPWNKHDGGGSHRSSPFPSSAAVTLLGNTAPGGCSALWIKKDDLVWSILSPKGGEPLAHCVGKKNNNKRCLILLMAPPSPWSIAVRNIRSFFFHVSESVLQGREDTHYYSISVSGRETHPRNYRRKHDIIKHIWRLWLFLCDWPRCCCTSSARAAADDLNFKASPRATEFSRLGPTKSVRASHIKSRFPQRAFICVLNLPPSTLNRCPAGGGVDLNMCIWASVPVYDTHAHTFSHIKLCLSHKEAPRRDAIRTQRAPDLLMNALMFGYVGHISFVF